MVNLSKNISKFLLLFLTRLAIWKRKPLIIGITGSIGKTTATKFTAALLKEKFNVVETEYEFATSLTTPLTILRIQKPKKTKNIIWFLPLFLLKTLWLLFFKKNYPECFVLELRSAISAGKGMKSLIKALQPKIGIITAIQPVHLTYFKSINCIVKAKRALIELLPEDGLALLNYDDPFVRKMARLSKAQVLFYGLSSQANIRAEKIRLGSKGLEFEIHYQGKVISIQASYLFNKAHIYPILIAVGLNLIHNWLSESQIIKLIKKLKPIEGRGNLVLGIKKTILINDAFNAAPLSVLSALDGLFAAFPKKRKIAVLGDMLQMEHLTQKGHQEIGRKVAQIKPDFLITVGKNAQIISQEAVRLGYPKAQVFETSDYKKASALLKRIIKQDDAILFKGSHGMKLYKIIDKLKAK